MTNWQPIETAPKDGRTILGYSESGQMLIWRWDTDRYAKKPKPYWRAFSVFGVTGERSMQPTHWMPLPEPPNSALTPPEQNK
jgi:hypothetical protein